ncbi:MAG: collagenase-like protease, partial [Spirochaetae bacterium HGW-Spirochaetae-6]
MTPIELLAPAKDFECGKAAVLAGADALYMGGPRFGARHKASNSLTDMARMSEFAHFYGAKVYAAFNTLLLDTELAEAQETLWQFYEAGVDAMIIQDMGILEMKLPPLPLFASTQTHNMTTEKVQFLEKTGFQRVILARELSLSQIKTIRSHTSIELEAFVHGALCVSHSGRCYLSYALGKRSGNRGDCAQPCREPYTLLDPQGTILEQNKHFLSLKDL